MRRRINDHLRRADTSAERTFYAERYPSGYHHGAWDDHVQRVAFSIDYIAGVLKNQTIRTVADLSCGDGAIPFGVAARFPTVGQTILGDINPSSHSLLAIHGALPGTIGELDRWPVPVDLFILSETIEHVTDPDFVLEQLRPRARYLFLSTPVNEPVNHGNPEHYWSWDTADMDSMLRMAGWSPIDYIVFTPDPRPDAGYDFQMWVCE